MSVRGADGAERPAASGPAAHKPALVVAIAGNPNTGKTTLLNGLVGANFTVGNWPGVTVEKKEGVIEHEGLALHFVDLPGIYTLEPVSDDERVAQSFLLNDKPDVILNVVETPNLERNLALTLELAEFGVPMVIALNMADEARQQGLQVDAGRLGALLGVTALPTIGRSGAGVKALLPAVVAAAQRARSPGPLRYDALLEARLTGPHDASKREQLERLLDDPAASAAVRELFGQDALAVIRAERLNLADGLYRQVVRETGARNRGITPALDAVLLHPVFGVLAYLAVMYLFFKISFDFSAPYMDWLDGLFSGFLAPLAQQSLTAIGAPQLLAQFVGEAVLGGFAFVLTFLPLIAVMFFLLTLLGMSGYMARLPFVLDRFMSALGLNGKAVIPLLLGLGCNVPAIMAARTLESTRDKLIVCAMIPFMSCPARLVVFSFFAVLFFPNPAVVIMAMYVLGIVVAIGTSLFMKQRLFKGSPSLMVLELPPYRMPRLRTVGIIVWSHVREFLVRAGRVIFTVSVVVWLLVHLPIGAKPQDSLVAQLGKVITPVFAPIGLTDWRATTSLIPAFLAREVALSFMATIYAAEAQAVPLAIDPGTEAANQLTALGDAVVTSLRALVDPAMQTFAVQDSDNTALKRAVMGTFTPLSALSFIILLLLYNSCLAVYGVMAKEIGRKFANGFMLYSFVAGWGIAFAVYRVGLLLGAG
jgi:ferrous iron transport protein B